jgi:hypothetical protein
MQRKTLLVLLHVASLAASPTYADVTCVYENTAIAETTPTGDFTDNGDGTLTHDRTGLVWMRCSLGQIWDGSGCAGTAETYSWRRALQVVSEVNSGASDDDGDGQSGFAGQTDWRLPNRNELESIVERRCSFPAINADLFNTNALFNVFWSSTPYAGDALNAWHVHFNNDGEVRDDIKLLPKHARLVRAGQ